MQRCHIQTNPWVRRGRKKFLEHPEHQFRLWKKRIKAVFFYYFYFCSLKQICQECMGHLCADFHLACSRSVVLPTSIFQVDKRGLVFICMHPDHNLNLPLILEQFWMLTAHFRSPFMTAKVVPVSSKLFLRQATWAKFIGFGFAVFPNCWREIQILICVCAWWDFAVLKGDGAAESLSKEVVGFW